MTTVFIAGKFESRERLKAWRPLLKEMGWECVSRWLDHPDDGRKLVNLTTEEIMAQIQMDLSDLGDADTLILDTSDRSDTGGREVEYGMAFVRGRHRVILIGPRRNLYHYAIGELYNTWQDFFQAHGMAQQLQLLERNEEGGDAEA